MSEEQIQNEPVQNEPVQQPEERPVGGAVKYYKEELEKTKKAMESYAKELEDLKTNQMKQKESYKELYELELNKRQEIEGKLTNLSRSFVDNLMRKEVESAALELGIRPEAISDLEMIDKSMIETETTSTGKINFLGVKDFVQTLKQTRPHWFKNSEPPKINTSNPSIPTNRELSASDILELQKKDPKRYNEIMRKRLGYN